jgi:hypothetical protein
VSACVRGSLVDDGGRAGIAKPADVEFEPPRGTLVLLQTTIKTGGVMPADCISALSCHCR